MKKFIIILIIIALVFTGYVIYVEKTKEKKVEPLVVEQEKAKIEEYYIYGTKLNMKGNLTADNLSFDEIDLVLYNEKDFISIPIKYEQNVNTLSFYITDLINDGFYLDNIEISNYNMFIRTSKKQEQEENDNKDEEVKYTYKYYQLQNDTKYPETIYYTMSKHNKKILINNKSQIYETMAFTVTKNEDKDIYDIVIDAGHGGKDPGAVVNGYEEKNLTVDLAINLKDKLEKAGLKVKLTRDKETLKDNEYFDEYGKGGRAQISHEVNAKYVFSMHLNSSESSNVHGLELYTPSNINYDFAKKLVEEILNNTNMDYSSRKTFKVDNGIYTHNFTEDEIASSMEGYAKKNFVPYDVTTASSYLYMIRETGGIMTGAYVDDRNEEQTGNDYWDSNVGAEAYLLETCYLSNLNDINIITNEQDAYINSIANTIITNLNK